MCVCVCGRGVFLHVLQMTLNVVWSLLLVGALSVALCMSCLCVLLFGFFFEERGRTGGEAAMWSFLDVSCSFFALPHMGWRFRTL